MVSDDRDSSPYTPVNPAGRRVVAVAVQGAGKASDAATDKAAGKIIASGRGVVAQQILQLAFERGIKVREDADLAELLVQLDLDTPIPSEAIVAVAEILAKVYEANARMASPDAEGQA